MKYPRLLTIFTPLLVLLCLEAFFVNSKLFYISLILANFIVFLTVFYYVRKSDIEKKWWNFIIMPLLTLNSVLVYTLLLSNKWLMQILYIGLVVFLNFYLNNIYFQLLNRTMYKAFKIRNFFALGSFLIMFFTTSGLLDCRHF